MPSLPAGLMTYFPSCLITACLMTYFPFCLITACLPARR
jgi:hypothetical protein